MREENSFDTLNGEDNTSDRAGLVVLLIVVGHLVFYLAPSFYLPFDLNELFVLGNVLVIADSGVVIFLGIKLFDRLLSSNKTK